jgi:hypothetical protein
MANSRVPALVVLGLVGAGAFVLGGPVLLLVALGVDVGLVVARMGQGSGSWLPSAAWLCFVGAFVTVFATPFGWALGGLLALVAVVAGIAGATWSVAAVRAGRMGRGRGAALALASLGPTLLLLLGFALLLWALSTTSWE